MKTKQRYFYVFFMIMTLQVYGQRVDLDKFYFDVNYQKLPQLFVPEENRTLGIRSKVGQSINDFVNRDDVYDNLYVYGWRKVDENPTIGIDFTLDDFVYKGSTVKTGTDVEKDKDGKIIKSITYYWVEATYQGRGNCLYIAPELPKKVEVKQEEKPVNMFLQNVAIEQPEESSSTRIPFDVVYTYKSSSVTSSKSAVENFTINKDAIFSEYLMMFVNESTRKVNNRLNHLYGFGPIKGKDNLWIQNSKKHEEYDTQLAAVEAVKVLFGKMEAEKSTDVIKENFTPLLSYLESLKTKYAGDDKSNVKMRYSAYYNKAKIYYYLDMPNEAIKEAEELIKNGYDISDGKLLIEAANELMKDFNRTGLTSRHIPLNNE